MSAETMSAEQLNELRGKELADTYRDQGWCVLRAKGKVPVGKWKKHQKRLPTDDEHKLVVEHAKKNRSLWLTCGSVSDTAALDIDTPEALTYWKQALGSDWDQIPRARSESRGYHLFLSLNGRAVATIKGDGWELRAEGAGVILPSGNGQREWEVPLGDSLPPLELIEAHLPSPDAGSNGAGPGGQRDPLDVDAIFHGVPLGERDDTAFRYACSLRARSVRLSEALRLMESAWERMEQAAGNEFTLEAALEKVHRVYREKSEGHSTSVLGPGSLTDVGNARRFAERFSHRLRFVPATDRWLVFEGYWRGDQERRVQRAAQEVSQSLFKEAGSTADRDVAKAIGTWAQRSHHEARLRAMVKLAENQPEIVLRPTDLDTDPWKLTCASGTLDLVTGVLHPFEPADLMTRGTDVEWDPDAECPRWERLFQEVFDGDEELIGWVRRFVGYCLTGQTHEQVFATFYGRGGNGKSTVLKVVEQLLGGFVGRASIESLLRQRDPGKVRNDLAALWGARLVTAAEPNEGRRYDTGLIKALTGEDKITARFLYKEVFTFTPEFKLIIVANSLPRIEGTDEAMWRRVRVVPFVKEFKPGQEPDLEAKLRAELPGILKWAVQGCLEWQREGLGEADAIRAASKEYRASENLLATFIEDYCGRKGATPTAEIRHAYNQFRDERGEDSVNERALGKQLAKLGIRVRSPNEKPRHYPLILSDPGRWGTPK